MRRVLFAVSLALVSCAPYASGSAPVQKKQPRTSSEHALEREVHNVRITMYATDWCGHCERARRWLDDHGLDYAEHDVEVDADARARRDYLNPRGTVPTFEIDGRVMVGFSPGYMRRAILTSAKRRMGN